MITATTFWGRIGQASVLAVLIILLAFALGGMIAYLLRERIASKARRDFLARSQNAQRRRE